MTMVRKIKEIDVYLNKLLSEGKTKKTIETYRINLYKWIEWAKIKTFDDILNVNAFDIENYNSYLMEKNLSSSTRFTYTICIQAFFNYLKERNAVKDNPVKLRIKITKEKETLYLSKEEVNRFLKSCKKQRDIALYSLIFSTGMRYSDLIQIKFKDIIREEDENGVYYSINVIGKGSKPRLLGFNDMVFQYINDYFYGDHPTHNPNDYLFVTSTGKQIDNKSLNRNIKSIARKAGFQNYKDFHIHTTRHSFASVLVEDGNTNLKELQEMMGHSNIAITTKIYTHINKERLARKMASQSIRFLETAPFRAVEKQSVAQGETIKEGDNHAQNKNNG